MFDAVFEQSTAALLFAGTILGVRYTEKFQLFLSCHGTEALIDGMYRLSPFQ